MERITIELDIWRAEVERTRRALRTQAQTLRAGVIDLPERLAHSMAVLDQLQGVIEVPAHLEAIRSISLALADAASVAETAYRVCRQAGDADGLLTQLCRSGQHLVDLEAAQGSQAPRPPGGDLQTARQIGREASAAKPDRPPYQDEYKARPRKPTARCPWCDRQVETTKGLRRLMAQHPARRGKGELAGWCRGTDSDQDQRADVTFGKVGR